MLRHSSGCRCWMPGGPSRCNCYQTSSSSESVRKIRRTEYKVGRWGSPRTRCTEGSQDRLLDCSNPRPCCCNSGLTAHVHVHGGSVCYMGCVAAAVQKEITLQQPLERPWPAQAHGLQVVLQQREARVSSPSASASEGHAAPGQWVPSVVCQRVGPSALHGPPGQLQLAMPLS